MINDLYTILLHGDYEAVIEVIPQGSGKKDQTPYECILALAYSLLRKPSEARDALAKVNQEDYDDVVMSICLEAEMLIAAVERENPLHIEELAKEATSKNPRAVFANRILGKIAESRKDLEDALQHYQMVLEVYPESQRTILDCARVHIGLKQKTEAQQFIKRANPSIRREIYRISAQQKRFARVIIALGIAALVLNPYTSVYAFWSITGVSVIGSVVAIRQRDDVIFSQAIFFEFVAIIYMVIKWIFGRVSTG